jgi:hypothetical protein
VSDETYHCFDDSVKVKSIMDEPPDRRVTKRGTRLTARLVLYSHVGCWNFLLWPSKY